MSDTNIGATPYEIALGNAAVSANRTTVRTPPTDTPSPLAAAVEALVEAVDDDCGDEVELNRLRYEELTGDRMHPKMRPTEMEAYWVRFHSWVRARVVALRAAVAADAAWRARAEAAIARCEAERQQKLILAEMTAKFISGNGRHNLSALLEKARDDEAAARRRYEETCRAG